MDFTLPLPPTKNQLHKIGKNRIYLSKQATDWKEEAGYLILSQRKSKKPIKCRCYMGISYFVNKDRDIDGGEAILDLFEDMGVIENDSQIYFLNVKKYRDKKKPRVEIDLVKM